MIEGAVIAAACLIIGYVTGRTRLHIDIERNRFAEPKPVCGCGHGYHDHDADTTRCHGRTLTTGTWRDCTCQRYTGPEPLPSYTAELGS